MRTRAPAAMPFLILVLFLLGSLAACGGGQGGDGGSQGGEQQGEQVGDQQDGGQPQGGQAGGGGRPQQKIALGTIESVDPESREVVLAPDFEAQGGDQITFKLRKNAVVRVNDQEAELSEVQQGQSAQVEYVTRDDVNRASAVEIVGGG
ncbi:MAG: hypothetical protein M3341_14570 [Actinomycetota bacterium]|nr:hypothetical protein [Actinomycetota bacterium]